MSPTVGMTSKEWIIDKRLDPRVMESISQVTSMENLKIFSVDLQDPTKMLQVGNELNLEDEQKLKDFLLKNMYVYA